MVHRYPSFEQSIQNGRYKDIARYRAAPYWRPSIIHVSETPGAELRLILFEKLSSWDLSWLSSYNYYPRDGLSGKR
jgi:hypothetical protein